MFNLELIYIIYNNIKKKINWSFFYNLKYINIYYYIVYNIFILNYFNKYIYNNNNIKIFIEKKKKFNMLKNVLKKYFKKNKWNIIQKQKNYNLIIKLKKKNLFLTFLDKNNNIIIKTNLGANGFKKKIKFTGYALENTTMFFCKKIKEILKKKWNKNIKIIWEKFLNIRNNYFLIYKNLKLLRIKRKQIFLYLKKTIKKNYYFNIWKYRKYELYYKFNLKKFQKILLQKYLYLILTLKNSIKYWAFNYIFSGLSKIKLIFLEIQNKKPITHSKGFRLKKRRRV